MPLLTEADPVVSGEGTIDPLGLYTIADVLGVRLVPGVRERQSHPRFLTAIAVSLSLCSHFDDDTLAADGLSEPWQVFEWYVVDGLVRATEDKYDLRGIPGRDKAARAIRDKVPLSASCYLKTPTVFGFHGIYRLLARSLGIMSGDHLGETGYDLVSTWAREQDLEGFVGSADGEGGMWRGLLLAALQDGIDKGAVARGAGWAGWQFFADHLSPYKAGTREAKLIGRALCDEAGGHRRRVLEYLISPDGQSVWDTDDDPSERRFHQGLLMSADEDLRPLLEAISAYERFARRLQDAFDDCLQTMTRNRGRTSLAELETLKSVKLAVERAPDDFEELVERLSAFGKSALYQQLFVSLAERLPPRDWVERLLEHHRTIQHAKPPNGKAPWYESFDSGVYVIRPGYLRDQGGRHDDEYVHAYRTGSLWSFALDLRMVK